MPWTMGRIDEDALSIEGISRVEDTGSSALRKERRLRGGSRMKESPTLLMIWRVWRICW